MPGKAFQAEERQVQSPEEEMARRVLRTARRPVSQDTMGEGKGVEDCGLVLQTFALCLGKWGAPGGLSGGTA